jgi:hypothetical protein
MRLRFFVRESSLVSVLTRPLTLRGPEGELSVRPGVVMQEGSRRTAPVEIVHAGVRVRLVLPPAVGRDHPAPQADRAMMRAERLAPGTEARLPDGAVAEIERDANVYVYERRPSHDGSRATITTPCLRFEALVSDRAVLPVVDLDFDDHTRPVAGHATLRSGARLFWSDGTPAGRTVTASSIVGATHAALGGRRCFSIALRAHNETPLATPSEIEICASEQDFDIPVAR